VRVSTAFNRMLRVLGAWVDSVDVDDPDIVVVHLRRKTGRRVCPCGWSTRSRYDQSRRRWRSLDVGTRQLWFESDIARVECRACGRVRTEEVPWARPGARHTRDFENVVAWLAQRMDKTSICRLLRCSWEAVQRIVTRVVATHLDDRRLDNLFRLGIDEISYKRGHRYLTIIADHDTGHVVWVGKGRSHAVLNSFYDALGPQRCAQLESISMDMVKTWQAPTRAHAPNAVMCFDPFHVIRWTNIALDAVYAGASRDLRPVAGKDWRRVRYALRAGVERLDQRNRALLNSIRRTRHQLWRAWELKEELRAFYQSVAPAEARAYLRAWIIRARRSRIRQFVTLARRIDNHFDGIAAAVEHDLSNSRVEAINAKIRRLNRRGFGHPNLDHLIGMIHLCLGGITIPLPTQT
jgi:transposase